MGYGHTCAKIRHSTWVHAGQRCGSSGWPTGKLWSNQQNSLLQQSVQNGESVH